MQQRASTYIHTHTHTYTIGLGEGSATMQQRASATSHIHTYIHTYIHTSWTRREISYDAAASKYIHTYTHTQLDQARDQLRCSSEQVRHLTEQNQQLRSELLQTQNTVSEARAELSNSRQRPPSMCIVPARSIWRQAAVLVRESVRVRELEGAYVDVKRGEEDALRRVNGLNLELDGVKRELVDVRALEHRLREVCMHV